MKNDATACVLSLGVMLAFVGGCKGEEAAPVDAGVAVDASIPMETTAAIGGVVRALALAAAMGAPLAPDGEMLRRDLAPGDTDAQTRGEHGFSGSSVVEPPACATYTWAGLSATITLSGCTLEAIGVPVSGSITFTVVLRPASFTATFTALTVGATTFDGFVTLHAGGTDVMATPTIDADLTFTDASGSTHLTATGLTTTASATSVAISGAATVTVGAMSNSLVATNVTWAMAECSPSSGSLLVTGAPLPLPLTLTFLATTPADGIVRAQLGSLPPTMPMLLMACP